MGYMHSIRRYGDGWMMGYMRTIRRYGVGYTSVPQGRTLAATGVEKGFTQ